MEIFARVINSENGEPVPFATVQRLYPDGQKYSAPVVADDNGYFNGRVPGNTYMWDVTAAGYNPIRVTLENAVNDQGLANGGAPTTTPLAVPMLSNGTLPEVIVTPDSGKNKTWLWIALAIGGTWYLKKTGVIKI